jgi:HK97 family phage prohead protease
MMKWRKIKMERQPDFTGWATRYNVKCSDGRTILPDAFKHCDGETVPLIWNHQHNDPACVVGHVVLQHRDEGMHATGYVNDTTVGKDVKEQLAHGDIKALSIYANHLKHRGSDVYHGAIREVSLVLAGANPGAYIDSVLVHGDGDSIVETDEARIYNDELIELYHSDDNAKTEEKEDKEVSESAKDKSILEIIEDLNPEQQTAVFAAIGMALDANAEDDDDEDENIKHSEGGNETMKKNLFDKTEEVRSSVLTHADQEAIVELAKKPGVGSLKQAMAMYAEENDSLAHGLDLGDADTLEELLPDHKLLNPGAPEILRADMGWVMGVINKVHKSPYSRIRTRYADARIKEAKDRLATLSAKGYNDRSKAKAINDHIQLIGRKTEPTTIFIKDELHRDDIIDITDFDVVAYTWALMKDNMYETLARTILVGDGREDTDPDKINENNVRPIWKDAESYTHHVDVDIEAAKKELQGTNTGANFGENYIYAEAIITAALYARETFKGSGTPDLYCAPHLVNVMLLARDLNGRRIYDSKSDLAKALNVNSIIEIEEFEGLTRTTGEGDEKKLLGLFVNLADYQLGSTKGGEITKFDDFDIDFNKYKYLMETRLSGALNKLDAAIALEEPVAAG